MIEATGPCRISIITKKQQLSAGSTRYITSVWAISDDRGVRMQQKRMYKPAGYVAAEANPFQLPTVKR